MSDNLPARILKGVGLSRAVDKLPVDLMPKQPKIGELKPGESGYAVPWIMYVDEEGYCYVDPTYRVSETPCGTVSLKVGRNHLGKLYAEASNAYRITFGYGYEWDITDNIPEHYLLVDKVY